MYIELNDRIERMSKSMQNCLVKYTCAGFVIPGLVTGLVNYYVLDLGEESFENDSPMMCVLYFLPCYANKIIIEIDLFSRCQGHQLAGNHPLVTCHCLSYNLEPFFQ